MVATHPTRLIVDLDAIRHNTRLIGRIVGERTAVMAIVKANAYGHGAVPVARAALDAGARWCGVATLPEGVALREAGVRAPILVLGYTPAALAEAALTHDLTVTLFDLEVARGFATAARAAGSVCRAHVKVDTGMGRLGVMPDAAPTFIDTLQALPGLEVDGVFTHFSSSDSDAAVTRAQIQRFEQATAGHAVRWRHACNSAGVFGFAEAHYDLVRPGLALYGLSPYAPGPPGSAWVNELKPALRWRTEVAQVKSLPDGATVGYGARYRCVGERRIAVLPVGYGDGLRRTPDNMGYVLVRGQQAPICGTVCMDQCMVDVTAIPDVRIGDEVVLIGAQNAERISVDDAAARMGTINYEFTTALLARPAREYEGIYPGENSNSFHLFKR